MAKNLLREVDVQASVNPNFLESTLTTDISVLESILDLIDNSIDAARDQLLENGVGLDKYGLPNDYSDFKIHIRLGQQSICILDNCGGIDEDTLKTRALRIADPWTHKFGIGHYGIGLKRALLKFGKDYAMSSDDGHVAIKMRFGIQMIGNNSIVGNVYETAGKRNTLFIVSRIKPEVIKDIERDEWFESAVEVLKIRYAVYTSKGLKISISSSYFERFERIRGYIPSLRKDCAIKADKDLLDIDGVRAFIDYGVHEKYYFRSEENHSRAANRDLTQEFGLYFVCNDRVIVFASKAKDYGWKPGAWHSEYNGFVAIVRFVSEDSTKIPWNTIKTAMRTENALFMRVKVNLQHFADTYRADARRLFHKNKNKCGLTSSVKNGNQSSAGTSHGAATNTATSQSQQGQASAGANPNLHIQTWETLLPPEFPCTSNEYILDSFIIEATRVKLRSAPIACIMLLRSILEKSIKAFIISSGEYQAVKDRYFEKIDQDNRRKNKDPLSEEYKNHQTLTLEMMLGWLNDKDIAVEVFGAERPKLALATKNASKHTKKMNGLVHGIDAIDEGQAREIRNEIYALIAFCVQKVALLGSKPHVNPAQYAPSSAKDIL
ncbi:MAG: ATP-binding protein [Acidobacteriia bacterium]|nr:ATP-binding protein [Terriglobia bacterium]